MPSDASSAEASANNDCDAMDGMTFSSATIMSGIAKNAACRAPSRSSTRIGSTVVGSNATSAATWLPAAKDRAVRKALEVDAPHPAAHRPADLVPQDDEARDGRHRHRGEVEAEEARGAEADRQRQRGELDHAAGGVLDHDPLALAQGDDRGLRRRHRPIPGR